VRVHVDAALDTIRTEPPSELLVAAGLTVADVLIQSSRHREALGLYGELRTRAAEQPDLEWIRNRVVVAEIQHRCLRGYDPMPIDAVIERARGVEATGDRIGARLLYRTAGELARLQGDIERSDALLEQERRLWEVSSESAPWLELECAINAILRADPIGVRHHADALYAQLPRHARNPLADALVELGWATLEGIGPRIAVALSDLEQSLPDDRAAAPLDVPLTLRFLLPRLAPFPDSRRRLAALLTAFPPG
jgi:hypothetical protein